MKKLIILGALLAATLSNPAPAVAYDDYDESQLSSSYRSSRAQERIGRSMDRLEQIERDRYRDERRQQHNDDVLSRSSRRFDRR